MLEFTVLYDVTTANVFTKRQFIKRKPTLYLIYDKFYVILRVFLNKDEKEGQMKIVRVTVLASITLIRNPYNSFS